MEAYRVFINASFKGTAYDHEYSRDQLEGWQRRYPDAFSIIVRRRLLTWPMGTEKIVASVKVLPLANSIVSGDGFEPSQLQPEDLANSLSSAKAIWVGDLVSTQEHLLMLVALLRERFGHVSTPVYCRTASDRLRHILLERYGARIVQADGRPAGARTVLVFRG
jgi:hypothetical protein